MRPNGHILDNDILQVLGCLSNFPEGGNIYDESIVAHHWGQMLTRLYNTRALQSRLVPITPSGQPPIQVNWPKKFVAQSEHLLS